MSNQTELLSILLPGAKRFLEENECTKAAKLLQKTASKAGEAAEEGSELKVLGQLPWDAAVQDQLSLPQILEIVQSGEAPAGDDESDKKKKKKEKKLAAERRQNAFALVTAYLTSLKATLDLTAVTKKLGKERAAEEGDEQAAARATERPLATLFAEFMAQKYGAAAAGGKKDKKKKKTAKRTRAEEEGEGKDEPQKKKAKKVKKLGGTSLAASLDMSHELAWQPKKLEGPVETEADKKKKKDRMDPILAREMNRRQDWDKWAEGLEGKDLRLQDGFHRVGDTWGDQAFASLSKVKGKSFVKEMQKKKRASWRGGGTIDMAVNSLMFSDSDE